MGVHLADLAAVVPGATLVGDGSTPIAALAYDSRRVSAGALFVAIRGHHSDGHAYLAAAAQAGAAALAVDRRFVTGDVPSGLPLLILPDSLVALAPLAARFYNYPGRELRVIGITGTKGKSTTSAITAQVLEAAGQQSGMISTVEFKLGARRWANTTRQSTPEAPEIQAMLREMATAKLDFAVLEATSHALSANWNRLGGSGFDTAVMLNVTHEHLDYHGSLAQYRRDKARLFELLAEDEQKRGPKFAIVNGDDPNHQLFLDAAPPSAEQLRFGFGPNCTVRGELLAVGPSGSQVRATTPWGEVTLRLRLPGRFNALNALAALTIAAAEGLPLPVVAAALEQIEGVKGRMEPVRAGQPFDLIVDYAHNPDSFEQVFAMLRPLVHGRMIAVFGSAGERDREKRPLQGALAARFCEIQVICDEDPRGEDRHAIIAEIAAGAASAGAIASNDQAELAALPPQGAPRYCAIADRRSAIGFAVAIAQPGDCLLLLGKGHEGSIIYADGSQPWDEAAIARTALAARFGGEQVV